MAPIVRASHENWDGSGYPDGLHGEEIPLVSRIIRVCDAFVAMTSRRPYREALGTEPALEEVERQAGAQFDPLVVPVLVEHVQAVSAHRAA
jgi:HD-GYP domain-containing protein (c-di-GMP phosphodiesterase class II)